MTGAELAVGYLCAWLVREAKRVAGPSDASTERLQELVGAKLGADPALERARAEAGAGGPSERTRQRLVLALDDTVERDEDFARALARLIAELRSAAGPVDTAVDTGTAQAEDGGQANSGVVRPGGAGRGSATVERTGNATAQGAGSRANTGVDLS